MDYMTLREAGEKWGISPRQINYYCSEGRIPGAESLKQHTKWPPRKGIGNKPSERWRKEEGREAKGQKAGRQ